MNDRLKIFMRKTLYFVGIDQNSAKLILYQSMLQLDTICNDFLSRKKEITKKKKKLVSKAGFRTIRCCFH